jgi:hypothetical protein
VPVLSVTMVLAGVVGGLTTLWGPVVAGVVFGAGQEVVGRVFSGEAANAFPQIASAALALVLVVKMPGGLAATFQWADDVVANAPPPRRAPGLQFRGLPVTEVGVTQGPLSGRHGVRLPRSRRLGGVRIGAPRLVGANGGGDPPAGHQEGQPALAGDGPRTFER